MLSVQEIHGKSIIHFTVGMHVAGPNDTNAGGKDALQDDYMEI